MSNIKIWDSLRTPPKDALKTIKGGRLSGMTDISPQWRYQVMTEVFGPCGIGWYYTIDKLWTEQGAEDQVMAFVTVSLFTSVDGGWSAPVQGVGGSMLVAKEKNGLHTSDEGYKMATTDALSVAMKMLGVAADIYSGKLDGSKYQTPSQKLTAADFMQEVDKLGTAEEILDWKEKNKQRCLDNLSKTDVTKVGSYCNQIIDALNSVEEKQ